MTTNLLLASGLFLSIFAANAQIQSENFEGSTIPSGWTTQISGAGDWTFGSNIPPYTGNPTFASNAAIFNDDALGGSAAASIASLLSPPIDVSSAASLNVAFDYYMNEFSGAGTFKAEAFDGAVWHQLLLVTTDQVTMLNVNYDVTAYKNANFQMRFTFDDEGGWSWGAAVDNFVLSGNLGVEENQKTVFGVFPNPASDVLHFRSDADLESISIFGISGQRVLHQQTGESATADISHLAPGAYFVTASLADGTSQTVKFLKK